MNKLLLLIIMPFIATFSYSMTNKQHSNLSNYSNIMQFVPSSYAFSLLIYNNDKDAIKDYFGSMLVNVASTHTIKTITQVKRPDYVDGDRKDSFPSGHTSFAFQGAFFAHTRYGLKMALPSYVIATSVGVSRVLLKRHHVTDVLGGIILAYASNALMVKKRINKTDIVMAPSFSYEDNQASIGFKITF